MTQMDKWGFNIFMTDCFLLQRTQSSLVMLLPRIILMKHFLSFSSLLPLSSPSSPLTPQLFEL